MKTGKWTALALLSLCMACNSQDKTGYIELNQIYDKFPLKKELEGQLQHTQNARKAILDSMNLKLHTLSNQARAGSTEAEKVFLVEQRAYLEKQRYFEEDNSNQVRQYDEQIWKQINQYVKDFGEEKGYDYVFGATGTGSVMYADKSKNITEEVSTYVNSKYKGSGCQKVGK